MAKFTLLGARVDTDLMSARLRDALRDIDHWRDRANAAEQDAAELARSLSVYSGDVAMARRDVEALQRDLISANREIDRLKATALPPPMDGGPVEPTTDPVQALIGEALDMEIGGAQK